MKTTVAQIVCGIACLSSMGATIYLAINRPTEMIPNSSLTAWGGFAIVTLILAVAVCSTDPKVK